MRFGLAGALVVAALAAACNSATYDPSSDANLTARDKKEFAKQSFVNVLPEPEHLRQTVSDPTNEKPGTIVVDTQNRWLYYVLPEGKAIRYGVATGKEAFAWSGVAKIGRKEQWPGWTPDRRHPEPHAPSRLQPAEPYAGLRGKPARCPRALSL